MWNNRLLHASHSVHSILLPVLHTIRRHYWPRSTHLVLLLVFCCWEWFKWSNDLIFSSHPRHSPLKPHWTKEHSHARHESNCFLSIPNTIIIRDLANKISSACFAQTIIDQSSFLISGPFKMQSNRNLKRTG